MDAKTSLFLERILQLQLRQNGIIEGLCHAAMMSSEDRVKLTDAAVRLTEALKDARDKITGR